MRGCLSMETLRRLLPYIRPHWHLALGTTGITFLGALSAIVSPWPLKFLIDSVLGDEPLPLGLGSLLGPIADDRYYLLIFAVLAGLFVTLMVNGLAVVEDYVSTKLDQRMVLDLRSDLFQHAQQVSSAFHDQRRTGDFMYRINYAAGAAGNITVTIPDIARNVLTLVGMFIVAFFIDAELALLSLAVVPFLYYSVGHYMKRIEPRLWQVREMEGVSLSIVHEAMSMLRVIVAFNRERYEYGRFREQGQTAVNARVNLTVRQTMFSLVVAGITGAGLAAVLGLGAHHVIQGDLTVGELLVIVSYIQSIYAPLEKISTTTGNLQEQNVNFKSALGLLDHPIEVKEDPDAIDRPRLNGHVSYKGVCFAYPERTDTLNDISFDARAGQVIAIVGPTGAGKSTLVSLLSRFFDPDQGQVIVDGIDIRKLTLPSLRRNVSVVLQEPLLFAATVRDNIRYGRLEATEEEVIQAAKDANAHNFISHMPHGYDTMLGERGALLSGGERQRISVARAFLKDAPILVLDEPTSSIDSRTESVILDALDRLMQGRTTFLIAHRLSTIRHADLILCIEDGKLVEQGKHEDLMAAGGLYRQLYEMQMGKARESGQQPAGGERASQPNGRPVAADSSGNGK